MGGIRDAADFAALVESLAANRSGGSVGKLHVIVLADVHDDPELARKLPKIRAIAEGILDARLARDEAYFSGAPGQYLLVFPRLDEVEGAVRAAALAREIHGHLFGVAGRDFAVTTKVVPLARLIARRARGGAAPAEAPPTEAQPRHGILLDAMFQPIWDSLGQALVGNRVTIRRIFHGREIFGPAVLFGGDEDPLALEVNAVLRRAILDGAARRATLFLPQVVNTLVLQDADPIRRWVGETARFHAGKLVIELAGGLAAAGRPGLRALIRGIRAEGAEVAVQSVPDRDLGALFGTFGVRYLCIDEQQIRGAGLSPSAAVALFTVIAHEVRNLGMKLCLWNVGAPREIKCAMPLGFRYFTGAAVGPTAAFPAEACPKSAEQVFA